jgi:hypothetical protein
MKGGEGRRPWFLRVEGGRGRRRGVRGSTRLIRKGCPLLLRMEGERGKRGGVRGNTRLIRK